MLWSICSRAEYRAFQLDIENSKTNQNRSIASTLDPDQYPGYFPLANNEVISYSATWMCYGNTSYIDQICLNPRPNNRPKIDPAKTDKNLPQNKP